MKRNYTSTPRGYITIAFAVLLLAGSFPTSVLAQFGRRDNGHGGPSHDRGGNNGTMRNESSRSPRRDRTFNQPPTRNNAPGPFNHGQSQPVPNRDFHSDRNNQRGSDRGGNYNTGNPNRYPGRGDNTDRNFGHQRNDNNDRNRYTFNRPAYRPEYRYDRRPVYSRYNPSWRYSYLPARNSCFYNLPSSYFSINFGGFGYRYWGGVFYRPYNNVFSVVAPPVGICINILPDGYRRIYVRDYPYYYFNGTYYDQRGDNYYVVSPPVGAVVESLPDGYQTVVIDGETYYTVDGAQYRPSIQDNGEIWYEVIKANG